MPKVIGYIRERDTGVGISGNAVTLHRSSDGVQIASTSTAGVPDLGRFELDSGGYPGRTYVSATTGGIIDVRDGEVIGQAGGLWLSDLPPFLRTFSSGVDPISAAALQVVAGSGLQVTVSVGTGLVYGYPYVLSSATNLAITSNSSGLARIDRVVLRLTLTGTSRYAMVLAVVTGVPATTPVAPALTQSADTWEIGLATVAVANAAAAITTGNITDERTTIGINAYTKAEVDAMVPKNLVPITLTVTTAFTPVVAPSNASAITIPTAAKAFSLSFGNTTDDTLYRGRFQLLGIAVTYAYTSTAAFPIEAVPTTIRIPAGRTHLYLWAMSSAANQARILWYQEEA